MESIKLTPKRKEIMEEMNFHDLLDVLRYYPYRYDHLKRSDLSFSLHDQKVYVDGPIITDIQNNLFSKKKMKTIFSIAYQDKEVKIILFNRFGWSKILKKGTNLVVIGKYNAFRQEIVASGFFIGNLNQDRWITYYSLKKEIKETTYKNFVRYCYEQAMTFHLICDKVPPQYQKKYRLISLQDAIRFIHFPENEEQLRQAHRYLKYEELLIFCLTGNIKRRILSLHQTAKQKKIEITYVQNFIHQLPFVLTSDQQKAVDEILTDMNSHSTMTRLLQGDVGSGKTIVALIALMANYTTHEQGALMAPTDILARQHFQYITEMLKTYPVRIGLLVSDMNSKEKEQMLIKVKNHEIDIVIGTHALIQPTVQFESLGLAIVDEQHRFGVKQRVMLKEKGKQVDVLYMSATPIPRTLASTIYMDMDVSTIEVYPYSNRVINTTYIDSLSIKNVRKQIDDYLQTGQKIYIVCPCIDESTQELSTVYSIYQQWQEDFPTYPIGLLHGKLPSDEKKAIMNQFSSGQIQILVSTTVIEVGINILDANMMIIYNAERFGLAQIHQLRGRIARDGKIGYCFLLSDSEDEKAIERLTFISQTNDGFKIAEYDLKNRGAGDMLGLAQSGKSPFVISSLIDDFNILKVAHEDAREILKNPSSYQNLIDTIYEQIRNSERYVD